MSATHLTSTFSMKILPNGIVCHLTVLDRVGTDIYSVKLAMFYDAIAGYSLVLSVIQIFS